MKFVNTFTKFGTSTLKTTKSYNLCVWMIEFEVLVVSHNGILISTKLPMTLNLTSLFTKCSHHGTPITPISVGLSFEVTRCYEISFSLFFNREKNFFFVYPISYFHVS